MNRGAAAASWRGRGLFPFLHLASRGQNGLCNNTLLFPTSVDYSCGFLCALSSLPRSLHPPRPSPQLAQVHGDGLRARGGVLVWTSVLAPERLLSHRRRSTPLLHWPRHCFSLFTHPSRSPPRVQLPVPPEHCKGHISCHDNNKLVNGCVSFITAASYLLLWDG